MAKVKLNPTIANAYSIPEIEHLIVGARLLSPAGAVIQAVRTNAGAADLLPKAALVHRLYRVVQSRPQLWTTSEAPAAE